MIEIRRIDKTLDYSKYDEIWMIVRSYKNPNPNIKHVPELSPQPGLFKTYRHLAETNQWNQDAFKNIYVPQFLYDLRHSQSARNKLNLLYQLDKAGKRICLLCYCADETLCHRSIIAGMLQATGCDVKITSGTDYTHYYKQWISIR